MWKESLKGVSSSEAFRLINIKGKDLNQDQRNALWKYWKEHRLNIDHWKKPENWVVDK